MAKRKKYEFRNAEQRELDTQEALAMRADGASVREIAKRQKRKPSTVFDDLKRALSKAKEANQDFIQEKLMESFQSLELAESEALEGWYESLEDAEKDRTVEKIGDKDSFQQTIKEIMGQSGNPQYLNVLIKVQLAKIKLFDTMNIKKAENSIWDKLFKQINSRKNTKPKSNK